jgi:serine/threonine-protein kinase
VLAAGAWVLLPRPAPMTPVPVAQIAAMPPAAPAVAPAPAETAEASAPETPSPAAADSTTAATPAAAPAKKPTPARPRKAVAAAPLEPPKIVAPAPPAPLPTGVVQIAVSPWGQIEVDGTSAGTTPPLTRLELPQGTHTITVRNDDFPPLTLRVQVDPDKPVQIKHRFGS